MESIRSKYENLSVSKLEKKFLQGIPADELEIAKEFLREKKPNSKILIETSKPTSEMTHSEVSKITETGDAAYRKDDIKKNINQTDSVEQNNPEYDDQYKGVGGWLLFFCVSLTILSPLITIGSSIIGFNETSSYFTRFPGLETITYIDLVLSIGLMAFSIYAGVALWSIKKDAVKIAKTYLIFFLIYVFISSFLPFMAGLPSSATNAMAAQVVKDAFRSIVYFSIWFSFLNKSKRVMATY